MPNKPKSDLEWLAVFLDTATTSDHPGEAENAVRAVVKLMRKAGLRGSDLIEAAAERDRVIDLLARFEARLTASEAENKKLRASTNGTNGGTLAQALWQDAGMPQTVESKHAQWALDLEAQRRVHLTSKEIDFLGSCSRRSRLSPNQQSWLRDIIRNAVARTGQAPPP